MRVKTWFCSKEVSSISYEKYTKQNNIKNPEELLYRLATGLDIPSVPAMQ
ncbi:hypothetical protein IMX26_17210 [Clostridium sp. 'deep sea']|nr:hypothetical protein [Clostridium sp. 'deep sea']QOR35173.1 hypothetical protein IMX26_17210 [Clostridium sp. 'deep sea']